MIAWFIYICVCVVATPRDFQATRTGCNQPHAPQRCPCKVNVCTVVAWLARVVFIVFSSICFSLFFSSKLGRGSDRETRQPMDGSVPVRVIRPPLLLWRWTFSELFFSSFFCHYALLNAECRNRQLAACSFLALLCPAGQSIQTAVKEKGKRKPEEARGF